MLFRVSITCTALLKGIPIDDSHRTGPGERNAHSFVVSNWAKLGEVRLITGLEVPGFGFPMCEASSINVVRNSVPISWAASTGTGTAPAAWWLRVSPGQMPAAANPSDPRGIMRMVRIVPQRIVSLRNNVRPAVAQSVKFCRV